MGTLTRIGAIALVAVTALGCAKPAYLAEIGAPAAIPRRTARLKEDPRVRLELCFKADAESPLLKPMMQSSGLGGCDMLRNRQFGSIARESIEEYGLSMLEPEAKDEHDIESEGTLHLHMETSSWDMISYPFRGDDRQRITYEAQLRTRAGDLDLGTREYHAYVSMPVNILASGGPVVLADLGKNAIRNLLDQLFADLRVHEAGLWQLRRSLEAESPTLPSEPIELKDTVSLGVGRIEVFGAEPVSTDSGTALAETLASALPQSACVGSAALEPAQGPARQLNQGNGRDQLTDLYRSVGIPPGFRVIGAIAPFENRLLLNAVVFEPSGGNALDRHLMAGEPGEDEAALFARFAESLIARLSCPASNSEETQSTL